ncbi:phenylalanine 4-monooxygenase [Nibribacter koreensis]|uniref:phenylalanine 4-monooxygenase n=1 Tax=Nibribacter koreensis TaxID=1084519 RepID=A0ABP8FAL9_9BACT
MSTIILTQDYAAYTPEHQQVWNLLYTRQLNILPAAATKAFLLGLEDVGFEPNRIPDFEEVNVRLLAKTGWQLVGVPGIVDNRTFFELLSQRKFPATTWLRTMSQLDYLEEPDMFHDVFAHVPLLANHEFVNFLEAMSQVALNFLDNEWAVELISRLYWYTVEFGLIEEEGELRIYGAGILSSAGETAYSLSEEPKRHSFNVRQILQTPYIKEKFQEEYFVLEDYSQLMASLTAFEDELQLALAQEEIK